MRVQGFGARAALMAGVLLLAFAGAMISAHAIEVTCVEASRYKHLIRIFENNPARMAAYIGGDPQRPPHPEACRAYLLMGRIDPAPRDGSENDFDRLLAAIRAGNGNFSTLYLASPGGSVQMGLRLGQITRMFWLSTVAIDGESFDYVPDFLGMTGPGSRAEQVPPELERGWRDYLAATQSITRVMMPEGKRRRCVSACTFIHAAGVHRYGLAYFHRARRSAPDQQPGSPPEQAPSMSDLLERLQKIEALIVAFFRQMDAGESAIQAYQSTATQRTLSAAMPPVPRYIDDHLKTVCTPASRQQRQPPQRRSEAPGDQPMTARPEQEQLQLPPTQPQVPVPPSSQPMQRGEPVNHMTNQCLASSNMRERLIQFGKLCAQGCDRNTLFREATRRIVALMPELQRTQQPNREPEPRRNPSGQPPPPQQPYGQPPPPYGQPPGNAPRGYPQPR